MSSHSLLRVAFGFIFIMTHSCADNTLSFPKDFLFGTATAAYQIEGGWNEDGKGENVWDKWTHDHPNKIIDGSNGDVACDSYHKYKEDVQLLKDIGVDFYRFSISWSRILPHGYANVINQEGVDYYRNLINELLANGIEPFVTLYHWDHPAVFESMGGWTNEMMVEWISDYARVVFKEFGPRVKYFMTINEPSAICHFGYLEGVKAPGVHRTSLHYFIILRDLWKPREEGHAWYDYSGVKVSVDPSWPKGASEWLRIVPVGFRKIIQKISNEFDYPSIFIMENGFSDRWGTSDYSRISYLHSYMKEMLTAIWESGCKVKGYAVWSLLDNFEWDAGYTERFGLVSVNFTDPNRIRTPKDSMKWYKNIIGTKKLSID